ncbi:protein decapping 5-like [Brassica napus]|uniref:protein decapping 5-like n=1 Tax=Brassica napus TaxID=3708 RepID=UPI002078D411|nr:protein decapping 5-like [Brassica napus]
MATDNSQSISSLSSSLRKPQPQNPYPVDYIGSFMTLVSKYGLRYQGFLYHLNHDEKTLCLINVICYGTEGRNLIEFHIPPSYELYSYIVFTTTQIKNVVVDSPASLARGLSSKIYRPPKPPLPYQYPSSNYYDPWLNHAYQPMPCAPLYQDPTYAAPSSIASQSFFTTYPSVPFSLGQGNGGFDFEALTKNFEPYKLWGPEGDNKQEDQTSCTVDGSSYQNETWNYSDDGSSYLNEIWNYLVNNNQEDQTACTIDKSSYMNSRKPFDPIGRPWNSFGPIERSFSYLPSNHELADLGFV